MVHASLCSRRLWRDRRPCPPGGNRRSGPGPRRRQNRNPCRQPQSDRLQDRAWRPEARLEIPAAAPVRVRCQRCRDRGGGRGVEIQTGRCGVCPRVARHDRHICRANRPWRKSRRAQAGFNFTRGSGFAAARRADHGADVRACRCEIRAADPDPCRLRRRRHVRGSIRQASRSSRDVDDEFEKRGFRRFARGRPRHRLRPRELSSAGWQLRYRLRHARWRIHRRCLQGGEARRRGDLAQRAAGSGFRPARRRRPAGGHRRLADGTEGLRRQHRLPGRDTNGPLRNPTATSCATSPPWWMAARSGRWSIANSPSSSCRRR